MLQVSESDVGNVEIASVYKYMARQCELINIRLVKELWNRIICVLDGGDYSSNIGRTGKNGGESDGDESGVGRIVAGFMLQWWQGG